MFRPMTVLDKLLAAAESRLEKAQAKLRAIELEVEALRRAIAVDEAERPGPVAPREKGK